MAELRMTGKKEPYAYTFKDPNLGELPILNSSNAWWLDAVKLNKLVDAYKFHATDDQACYYAGISKTQLLYFQELHPDFYRIKDAVKQDANLRARKRVIGDIDKDTSNAWKWLERTEKDIFSPRVEAAGLNGRDLFDGVTAELKALTEGIRKRQRDEKYTGEQNTDHPDAGPDGAGDVPAAGTDN